MENGSRRPVGRCEPNHILDPEIYLLLTGAMALLCATADVRFPAIRGLKHLTSKDIRKMHG